MFFKVALSILLCCLPLFAGFFIFIKMEVRPLHLFLAILYGLLSIIPSAFIQYLIPAKALIPSYPILESLLRSLLLYGFLEEAFKTLFILPLPKKNYSAKQFLCLSFMAGLSFCCFESVVYFLDFLQNALRQNAHLMYGSLFLRFFTSDIIHTVCAGLGGLFIYSCFIKTPKPSILIMAILLHGVYDFFAGFTNNLRWFYIVVLILAILECRIKYKSLVDDQEQRACEGV
ncbi:MAG: PrsW family glutamic-type intramembrane protease [Treponema sp.]|nr:PrsW family glutamic-type intramembrane protease [Treponema sp.]